MSCSNFVGRRRRDGGHVKRRRIEGRKNGEQAGVDRASYPRRMTHASRVLHADPQRPHESYRGPSFAPPFAVDRTRQGSEGRASWEPRRRKKEERGWETQTVTKWRERASERATWKGNRSNDGQQPSVARTIPTTPRRISLGTRNAFGQQRIPDAH